MVKINKIKLNNFRNFNTFEILFDKKTNIFFGINGSGKTNILESISLISKGRGLRNANIVNLIKNERENFHINCQLEIKSNQYNVDVFSKKKEYKYIKEINLNNDSSKESINFLNSSLSFLTFLPEMERLFQSSPTFRRNFLDRLIFSEQSNYNKLINKYKKNVVERSKILQQNQLDPDWINVVEKEICAYGLQIYKLRYNKLDQLNNNIKKLNSLNNYQFDIDLKIKDDFFDSRLNEEKYMSALSETRLYDKKFGGIRIGPHKTDISATINNSFDALQLSTGQQKTIVLMLLLAQCDILLNIKNIKPILLLDEICSHLDSNNRKILLDMINNFNIQFFLTGTEKTLFSFISTNVHFYNITDL